MGAKLEALGRFPGLRMAIFKGCEVWGINPDAYNLYAYNSKNSGVGWAAEHLHCSSEARIISKAFLGATPEPRLLPVLSLVLTPCAFKC